MTVSATTAAGVPSPQPPIGRVAVTLATVARVLGSSKVASTIVPVFWPSTAVKFRTAPVTGRSVMVKVAKRVNAASPSKTSVCTV